MAIIFFSLSKEKVKKIQRSNHRNVKARLKSTELTHKTKGDANKLATKRGVFETN